MFITLFRPALALLLWLAAGPGNLRAVEIIAHRGASFDAPENTLASMKLGWAQNADGVELDLWLSKDGRLIVFHDKDTKRFEPTARAITNLTLAEARQLDVGAWKGEKFKGETIPTLESILATTPKGKRIVLEIKDGPHLIPEFTRVLKASGVAEEKLVVISFNFASLAASKKDWPQVDHYFLMDYQQNVKTKEYPELKPLIARAKKAGFEGLNLSSKWPLTKDSVAEVKAAGLKMYVWTVDDADLARALVSAGVDGITTNRPEWLRERLK